MANRKLLSCGIDELKEKIILFYFSVGGFSGGYDCIKILKDDTQIKYICNQEENIFTGEKLNEFLYKLFNENILKWKREYNNNDILDGTQWELKMEFKDLPKFKCYGSNEYPSNWKNILTIINEYFPQMELDYCNIDDEKE